MPKSLHMSTSSAITAVLRPRTAGFHGTLMISGTRVPSSKLVNFSHSLCSPSW